MERRDFLKIAQRRLRGGAPRRRRRLPPSPTQFQFTPCRSCGSNRCNLGRAFAYFVTPLPLPLPR
jgi:hypothetical protein